MQKSFEENPFEDAIIAKQWINSVEGEKGMTRDNESYPHLKKWHDSTTKGVIVDIGSGQGVCSEKINDYEKYIGVEPSIFLTERAKELYSPNNREFIVGNAYELPVESNSCDQAMSFNVWFHLADINLASQELSRVLKKDGRFWIHTADYDSLDTWKKFYINPTIENNKIVGEVRVPVNNLSNNTFYLHTNEDIKDALEKNGLVVEDATKIGTMKDGVKLFVIFEGYKK